MKRYSCLILVLTILTIGIFIRCSMVSASEATVRTVLNKKTIKKGFTVNSSNNNFKIGITPDSLIIHSKVKLSIKQLNKNDYNLDNQTLVSALYSFDFTDNAKVRDGKPIWLSIKYKNKGNKKGSKVIKYWDNNKRKWRKLPSQKKKKKKIVQGYTHLEYAVIGVFNVKSKNTKKYKKKKKKEKYNNDYQVGYASWYNYEGAASTKYPHGSIVKVTNLANNKTCEVTILDYGPFIAGRVIDLSRQAFSEIADLGTGVIKVKVEPVYIP